MISLPLPLPSLDLTVTSLMPLLNILGLVHFKMLNFQMQIRTRLPLIKKSMPVDPDATLILLSKLDTVL